MYIFENLVKISPFSARKAVDSLDILGIARTINVQ